MKDYTTTPPSQGGMPIIGRPIINANINVTNRIESKDIDKIMMDTFADIADVLSNHCGPYGEFAMIVNPTNGLIEPTFTKDGIGIVRAMEYMSPMQEFVRNTLIYMGSRVETAAGDGTTSSMIICARGLEFLLAKLKQSDCKFTYQELQVAYTAFVEKVLALLDENKYTVTDDEVYPIAYCQAMTSSHSNKELSQAVAKLFSETPREAWNYLYIEKNRYENNKLYDVALDNSQYTVENVHAWPAGTLTEDLGSARRRTSSDILISSLIPLDNESHLEGHQLFHDIKNAIETNTSLTVICPRGMDNSTMNQFNQLFKKYPEHDVVFFFVDADDPRLNDIVCMKALANDLQFVTKVTGDYSFTGGNLSIESGLYPNETDSKLNPMIGNPEYKTLNDMLDALDKIIAQVKSSVANKTLNADVARLQKLRLKLMVSKRSYFLIGGSAYDAAAAADVVIDAILAVKNTLTNGYGLGGNKTLYRAVDAIRQESTDTLEIMFSSMFAYGIEQVHTAIYKLSNNPQAEFDATVSINIEDGQRVNVESFCDVFVIYPDMDYILIIQPIATDIELIKRFGELALKFVKTNRIIAPGGLYSNVEINTDTETNPL